MDKLELTPENLQAVVERYRDDIQLFGIELFGFDMFDAWQKELIDCKLGTKRRRISIGSAHATGKTLLAVLIALHHIICYPYGQVFITSTTGAQLFGAFGNKLEIMTKKSALADWFDVNATKVTVKGLTGSFIALLTNSVNNAESFQGHHTEGGLGGPLFIVDEASGVHDVIINAITNNLMEENSKLILLGNTIIRTGEFFESFGSKHELYHTIKVTAFDSSFADPQYIEDKRREFGEDSDEYRIRILAEFPHNDCGTYILSSFISEAYSRNGKVNNSCTRIGGLDVSGAGKDKTTLTVRQGNVITHQKEYADNEPSRLLFAIENDFKELDLDVLNVDGNGVGYSLYTNLFNIFGGAKIKNVDLTNLGIKDDKEFFNKRARLWGRAKAWLKHGTIIPTEFQKNMEVEGSSLLNTYDSVGRIVLESKQDAKRRNPSFHSPDFFDSFAYTFNSPDGVRLSEADKLAQLRGTGGMNNQLGAYLSNMI